MSAIKLRIGICVVALTLYIVLFNVYMSSIGQIPQIKYKLLYNYLTVGMVLFCLFDFKAGFQNYTHQQLNLACFLCLIIHYIIIILHWHFDTDTAFNFSVFNGAVLLTLLMILLSSIRWKH